MKKLAMEAMMRILLSVLRWDLDHVLVWLLDLVQEWDLDLVLVWHLVPDLL